MESYTRLTDAGRSADNQPAFTPPFSSEYDQRQSPGARLRAWWAEHIRGSPAKQYPVSGYLTLIPLSGKRLALRDSNRFGNCSPGCSLRYVLLLQHWLRQCILSGADERLKPRRTKLLVGGLVSPSFPACQCTCNRSLSSALQRPSPQPCCLVLARVLLFQTLKDSKVVKNASIRCTASYLHVQVKTPLWQLSNPALQRRSAGLERCHKGIFTRTRR